MFFLFGFTDRLVGHPELYLWSTIGSLVINVSLDYVLIKVLGLGIQGAALATGFAYTVAFIIVMLPMLKKHNSVNLLVGHYKKAHVAPPMIYNGSSEGVVSIAAALSAIFFLICHL